MTNLLSTQSLFDTPDKPAKRDKNYVQPATYAEALRLWSSVEEISQWIRNSFSYDREKALKISETDNKLKPQILSPEEFYVNTQGICVDLARFAYETMLVVAPKLNPKYLMIEFEPLREGKSLLRRHWMIVYQRDSEFYSFADSKRPGHISAPFKTMDALIRNYQKYRGRKIVSYQVLVTYQKQRAKKLKRMRRETRRPAATMTRSMRASQAPKN